MAYSKAQYSQDITLMHDDALMHAIAHNVPYSNVPYPVTGHGPEALLEVAAEAQTAYWDALRKLEEALGVEIEDGRDLRNATIESLLEA